MIKSLKINKELEEYISKNSYDLHPIQKAIINHNEKLGSEKKMQISVSQGYFFQFIIKTFKIKKILEIGTFTGYSSVTMALALSINDSITCLEKNIINIEIAKNFFKKARLEQNINIIPGPALNSLNKLICNKEKYDLIFIDADKENYENYYNLSFKLLNSKGFILIDNVLWHGDVANKNKNDKFTNIIREFNSFVKNDNRVEKIILPIGDGVTICRKV